VEVADWEGAKKVMESMQAQEGLKISEPLQIAADQKTALAKVMVNGKGPITLEFSLASKAEVRADREGRIRADIRVDYETMAMLNSDIHEMKRNLADSKSETDPKRIEEMKKKGGYVEPAKVAEYESKIAEYERIFAEAKQVFEATLKAQRRTAGGIPYSEATTAQIGTNNMPEGAGVAGFKPISEIEAKTNKIAQAKPSAERLERYIKYLVEKKKMSRADAEVVAKVWSEQVIADARAYQAGRTHIYDTSLPAKPETAHMDPATVDHHGRFANPKNSTEQLIGKMEASLEVVKGDTEALDGAAKDVGAVDAARRGLREAGVQKPTEKQVIEIAAALRELNLKEVTTDNLADGGWSVWIAKNQARILADPALRKRVEAATHFEDFTAFGTEYNPKDPAVRLQAALFQEYGKILKDNGIIGSDRFTPAQAPKVMGEALNAIDKMVFNPNLQEASAAEFFEKIEAGKKVASEKGLIPDASVHSGDTNLSFFDLTKLGEFTVFQQWLALPRVAPSGKPDTIQVSVVPMKPLEATVDGKILKADRKLQIVAIPNGRELPSKKGLLTVLETMNRAEVAKAEALGLTPKEGESPKQGQLPRDHFSTLWFGKDNVILPNPAKGGSLLTTSEVSGLLTGKSEGAAHIRLFRASTVRKFLERATPDEIASLTDSHPQMIDRIAGFKFHFDGKTYSGLELLAMDNPYPAVEVFSGKSGYPEMEKRLLGALALRELRQPKHSAEGLEFLAKVGIDPKA
ncbi:MAG: hypothetical protein K8R69_01850, partial [Deltaproteobacteria bacterium]|nr:hypothetical protein [Deltaproteobacteria bacterium]